MRIVELPSGEQLPRICRSRSARASSWSGADPGQEPARTAV